MVVEGLDDHLTDTFACPHDIRRVYCLIRGNEHEFFYPVKGCRLGCLPCPEYIILHRFIGAVFHQGHVFVSRRMVYNIRLIMFKNPVHPVGIAHRCDQHCQVQIRISGLQFLLYVINVVLINIHNN